MFHLFHRGEVLALGDDLKQVHGFAAQLLDALPQLHRHLQAHLLYLNQ